MGRRSGAPTRRQLEALVELCRQLFTAPVPQPCLTIRALGEKLGIRSTNATDDLLTALAEKGYVVRLRERRCYWPTEAGYKAAGKVILEDEWRAARGGA